MRKISHKSVHNFQKDTPFSCMSIVYSYTISNFAKADGLEEAFMEVGSSSH